MMNSTYVRLDAGGHIWGYSEGGDPPTEEWVMVDMDIDASCATGEYLVKLQDGSLVITDQPRIPTKSWSTWNPDSGAWEDKRYLSEIKSGCWSGIKMVRDQHEFGGFVFDGATYDSDTTAQQRIQGAMLLASQDSSASMTWTLANNNTVELNAEKIINLGKALAEHVSSVHDKARELRVKIEAATSTSELDAIAW